MKQRDLTLAGKIFLFVFAILCILIIVVLNAIPSQKPTTLKLGNTNTCVKVDGEWVSIKNFTVDQPIHVCGNVSSNDPSLHAQIQIRVYENEITTQDDAIFYDNLWISNGERAIPVSIYLQPGSYIIQVSSGRKTLSIVNLEIVE